MLLLSTGAVAADRVEHLAGDIALQAADDLGLVLALADAAGDVVAGSFIGAHAHDRDSPERGVRLAVAAAVESMPAAFAAAGLDG